MKKDRETWIAARAHEIWETEGRPHGQHDEHWKRAAEEYGANQGVAKGRKKAAPEGKEAKLKKPARAAAAKASPTPPEPAKTAAKTGKAKRSRATPAS